MNYNRLYYEDLYKMDGESIIVFIYNYGHFKAIVDCKRKRVYKADEKRCYWSINRFRIDQNHITAYKYVDGGIVTKEQLEKMREELLWL